MGVQGSPFLGMAQYWAVGPCPTARDRPPSTFVRPPTPASPLQFASDTGRAPMSQRDRGMPCCHQPPMGCRPAPLAL